MGAHFNNLGDRIHRFRGSLNKLCYSNISRRGVAPGRPRLRPCEEDGSGGNLCDRVARGVRPPHDEWHVSSERNLGGVLFRRRP